MARHRIRRAKAWTWRWKPTLLVGGAAALLFIINARRASASEPPAGGVSLENGLPLPTLPGSLAPTQTQISTATDYWSQLTPGPALSSGYINFPSGSQAAAALFPTRLDAYGSPYVQWAGQLYIVVGPDASGNYTATRVMV